MAIYPSISIASWNHTIDHTKLWIWKLLWIIELKMSMYEKKEAKSSTNVHYYSWQLSIFFFLISQLYVSVACKPLLAPGGSVKLFEATASFCDILAGKATKKMGKLVYLVFKNYFSITMGCPVQVFGLLFV